MERRELAQRLLERATFGPRPGEVDGALALGAEGWLAGQLDPEPDPGLARHLARFRHRELDPAEGLAGLLDMDMASGREAGERLSPEQRRRLADRSREITADAVGARLVRAVYGARGLREVMIDFWSNHFSVYARKRALAPLLPHYQREVLEPLALGRFEDLLVAVAKAPAMLLYLDNWASTDPHSLLRLSPRVRRALPGRGRGGINENYARELLELHTLGVDGGYTQADVQEVARVFTGWTLESRRTPVFRFRELLHDPGDKRVLGERIRGAGQEEGEGLLRRLARHPSTARHLATKLVRRFVCDEPPPPLTARVATRFLETEGDIPEVLRAILLSPELADPARRKLKTPLRFAVSALRTTGGDTDGSRAALFAVGRLGELPFLAHTPAGFPEEGRHWIDPGAMLGRMRLAFVLASGALPGTAAGRALPGSGSSGARRDEVALALASPEFQWA